MTTDIKELVKRLREKDDFELAAAADEAADALEALAEWKRQALALEATWDVQAVGRIIKVPLGANILPAIQPALEAMAGEVEDLKHDIARHMTIANEAAAERDRLAGEVVLLREAMMEIDPHLDEDTEAVQRFRKALEATK